MKKPLKKLFCALVGAAMLCPSPALAAEELPEPPELYAEAAVLMDADTGQVLYGKNEDRQMQPASLTKIMTCLLAMELGDPDDLVTVTPEALRLMRGSSTAGLREGETLTLAQMLYALMLPSANDAANAIAIHLAGSTEEFAQLMNRRAEELGLTGSHFSNAHGLPARDHVTTAYDLAAITREALTHSEFLDYAGSPSYFIPAGAQNQAHSFTHLNKLLRPSSGYYDPEAIAGKTGWTMMAGNCLMTVARRDGTTLIAVVLHSDADGVSGASYLDTEALFTYGFENFQRVEVSLPSVEEYSLIFTDGEGDLQQAVISGEASVLSALLPDGVSPQKVLVELPGEEDLAGGLPDALTAQVMACSEDGEKLPWPVGTLSLQARVDPVPVEEPAAVQPDPVPEAAQESGSLGILWAGLGAAALAAGVVFFLLHRARPRPHP